MRVSTRSSAWGTSEVADVSLKNWLEGFPILADALDMNSENRFWLHACAKLWKKAFHYSAICYCYVYASMTPIFPCQCLYSSLRPHALPKTISKMLSFFNEQYVHGSICNDNECSTENCEPNDICPQSKIVESECAQYTSTGYFYIEPVAVVYQA